MKKLIPASLLFSLLVGCSNLSPLTVPGTAAAPVGTVIRDMGFPGGSSLAINLYTPAAAKRGVLAIACMAWALEDIYSYDVTLTDVTGGTAKALTTFTVVCKTGHAEAVFAHLKPGLKYSVAVVAKGNKGGTAATSVLNAQTPAIGYFDLTTDSGVGGKDLHATVKIQLDGCAGGAEDNGSIDLIPIAGATGGTSGPESGHGVCLGPDKPVADGCAYYDSTFGDGTNGDVFSDDDSHNHWTNAKNNDAWIQKDLPEQYELSGLHIGELYADKRYDACDEVRIKCKGDDDQWTTLDSIKNANLKDYDKKFETPVHCKSLRIEAHDKNGWISCSHVTLTGHKKSEEGSSDCGTQAPAGTPTATPAPTATAIPTKAPSAVPTTTPTATPTPTKTPAPKSDDDKGKN